MAESALRNLVPSINTAMNNAAQAPFGRPQRIPIYRNEPEFIDRTLNPQNYPVINNPDGSISSHRMAAEVDENGNWYVFPTIQMQPDGTLRQYDDAREAMKAAFMTGNILSAPNMESALQYAEGGYKVGTPMEQPRSAPAQEPVQPAPESALRQLVPQSAEPFVRSYNPFNPAFRETMRASISDLLGGRAIGGTPTQRYRANIADMLTGAVEMAPGVGEAVGVTDTRQAIRSGDYGTAAMLGGATALGMVPVIGDAASRAIREGLDMSTAAKSVAAKKGIHPAIQEYAQMAGFDPRILQAGSGKQISNPRIADIERIQGLNVNIGNQRIQDVPVFNIEDYEGYPIMSSMSDRAAAGDVILDVNGVPVNVNRRGGQDFMFDPINQGKVWASDAAVVLGEGQTRMMNMAQRLKQQYGKDPLFAPWTMAPTGVDYSTMTGETMLQYAANNMNKNTLRSLNKDLKSIFPDWQGIESPSSMQQFYAGSGDDRKAVIQLLDKKYRNKGSMTSGEARIAVTDAAQLRNPDGTLRNVGRIEASAAPFTQDVHPTYNTALPGTGVGRLQSPLQVYELFPDAARLGGFDPMNPPRPALRALEMKPYATLITEDLIRGIQARRLNQQ